MGFAEAEQSQPVFHGAAAFQAYYSSGTKILPGIVVSRGRQQVAIIGSEIWGPRFHWVVGRGNAKTNKGGSDNRHNPMCLVLDRPSIPERADRVENAAGH